MNLYNTALVLIGYQNDYFAQDGILRPIVEESIRVNNTISNTVKLLEGLCALGALPVIIATPIIFSDEYSELEHNPVGILHHIKELGAFKLNQRGSETVPELLQFGERIHYLPGKSGLNAFSNTGLYPFLISANIENIVLAGAVTSICIDSTGRAAYERDLNVHVLSDCTSARTTLEQEFYCRHIFPLYANVLTHQQLLQQLTR